MLTVSAILAITWKLFLPVVFVVCLVDVLTQSQRRRIRSLYRSGRYSQRSLADRLGITRHAVRSALA